MANELHAGDVLRHGDREYVVRQFYVSHDGVMEIVATLTPRYPARSFDVGDVLANNNLWGVVQSYTFNEFERRWEYMVCAQAQCLRVWYEPHARLLSDAAKEMQP
jgi:hypothetical protein